MMTKENFIKRMKLIQDFHNKKENMIDFFNKVIEENDCYIPLGDNLTNEMLQMISENMNIKDDLLEWWLYEPVEKIIYYKDEEISVKTLEELYDYLQTINKI